MLMNVGQDAGTIPSEKRLFRGILLCISTEHQLAESFAIGDLGFCLAIFCL